jgi:hypothetical protein
MHSILFEVVVIALNVSRFYQAPLRGNLLVLLIILGVVPSAYLILALTIILKHFYMIKINNYIWLVSGSLFVLHLFASFR